VFLFLQREDAMPIPAELKDVRDLFTATEYGLLEASYVEAPAAELKKKLALARSLRDKWKDQYTRQRRARQTERGGRAGAENDRSHAKQELFAEAVRRFEALLLVVPEAAPVATKAARKKPTKAGRTRAHRQDRVTTRKTLRPMATRATAAKKAAPVAAPAAPVVAAPVAPAPAAPAPVAAAKKTAPRRPPKGIKAPKVKGKAKGAKPAVETPSVGRLGVAVPGPKSAAASAKAKKTGLKLTGLTTRTRGHVSAAGKRAQGKKDTRGRR
jgi:hypothetical protein